MHPLENRYLYRLWGARKEPESVLNVRGRNIRPEKKPRGNNKTGMIVYCARDAAFANLRRFRLAA